MDIDFRYVRLIRHARIIRVPVIAWVMHPYVARVLDRVREADPIEVLQATPARLELFLEAAEPNVLGRSYATGKWSAATILAHLADVEQGLGYRLRQGLAETDYAVEPFDQDAWVARSRRVDPSLAVEVLRALRPWHLAILSGFDLDDWLKPIRYTFEGIDSLDMLVRFWAGHDLNHLEQLEIIAEEAGFAF